MSEQTPQERTQEIREREQQATTGPYKVIADGSEGYAVCAAYDEYDRSYGRLDKVVANADRHEDAAFFKYARDDVPWLLARVAQLEQALEAERRLWLERAGSDRATGALSSAEYDEELAETVLSALSTMPSDPA